MNVVLIGFRCAGKTTIGKFVAERLAMEFVDSDDYIEKETSLSIREIFEKKGESFFRLLETDAIAALAKVDGRIIATGGGSVLRYKNTSTLKRNSFIIFLDVDAQHSSERVKNDPKSRQQRPPLTAKDPFDEIKEQLAIRRPYYLNVADRVIDTNEKTVEEVVDHVMALLRERGLEHDTQEQGQE